jgi:phosphatidylethanolamine-binding protein (PEBP) family uncharacterized protein
MRMSLWRLLTAAVIALLVAGALAFRSNGPKAMALLPASLQAGAPPPVLSSEHKLQFQVVMKDLEIARLKYEAAQHDFADAQRAAAALVEQTKIAGYDLDLQTFAYVPLPKK